MTTSTLQALRARHENPDTPFADMAVDVAADRLLAVLDAAMPDCYDRAVEYLTEHPGEIHAAWTSPYLHPHGCLFKYAGETGTVRDSPSYGCLTQVRGGIGVAATWELTEKIQYDDRLPGSEYEITVESLPAFAEHQRAIDLMFPGRTPAEIRSDADAGDRLEMRERASRWETI